MSKNIDKGNGTGFKPRMDTDGHRSDFPVPELTYTIIGSAMEVLNVLGHGLHEKPYERALIWELRVKKFAVIQQRRFDVLYKGCVIGEYIPDIIIENQVIVDAKVIENITDHERGQMLNYLSITGLKVGLILNFKRAKLQWDRMIL